jgi:hypothetical protein
MDVPPDLPRPPLLFDMPKPPLRPNYVAQYERAMIELLKQSAYNAGPGEAPLQTRTWEVGAMRAAPKQTRTAMPPPKKPARKK